jgi:hypothetical protein
MGITDPAMFLATTAVFGPKGQGTMVQTVFQYRKSPGMMMVMMSEEGCFRTGYQKNRLKREREREREREGERVKTALDN